MWRPILTLLVFWRVGHIFSMSFDWLAAKVDCDWLSFGMWRVQKETWAKPMPEKVLGIAGQESSDSKPNRLQVDIFRFCFIHLRYIL